MAVFQIVTVGAEATALTERLQAAGEYSESFFTHGLSVQTRGRAGRLRARAYPGRSRRRDRIRANAIRGVIPPAPTWRSMRSSTG